MDTMDNGDLTPNNGPAKFSLHTPDEEVKSAQETITFIRNGSNQPHPTPTKSLKEQASSQSALKSLLENPSHSPGFGHVRFQGDDGDKGSKGGFRMSVRNLSTRIKNSIRESTRRFPYVSSTKTSIEEDEAWMAWIEERTGSLSREAQLDSALFKKILGIEKAYYSDRLFNMMDLDNRGYIVLGDLLKLLSAMTKASSVDKLKVIFDLYDADGNGNLDHGEFTAILSAAIDENALAISPQQIDYMTQSIFSAVDTNLDGVITFDELRDGLDKFPAWNGILQISFSRFLHPPTEKSRATKRDHDLAKWCPPYFMRPSYIRHNPREFIWGIIYFLSVVAFYLYGSLYAFFVKHDITTPNCLKYYVVAHGFGMDLNWNCMLLVVFMLRRTLTYIRNTRIGPYLPIDMAVYAHKVIGYVVCLCTLGHFVFHMVHFKCLELDGSNFTYAELLFTTKPGIGLYPGVISVTGWPIFFSCLVMFICSLPIIRRSGLFEVFYFTHLLYLPFLTILIAHSDKFWKFIIAPGILFILEKISMTRCVRHILSGEFFIKEVVLWSSGVTQLTMNHPPGFTYNPGDYIFINIPNVAWFEWHPFTISSCPEHPDVVTLHIRCLGEWTKRLHTYFKNHDRNCGGIKVDITNPLAIPSLGKLFPGIEKGPSVFQKKRASVRGQPIRALHVPIYVDGPYGTPSGHIFTAEHAVLVCAGIGVTPFASILQSIMFRHRTYKVVCPQCGHEWCPHQNVAPKEALKKVTFIWVVNSQRSIEWFVELLEQLDVQQLKENELDRLIDIRIYVTSATKMADLYAFALTTALDIFYEKHNRDMITGIRSRAVPGRPDWKTVFDQLSKAKKGRVTMFFCGPPVLAQELRSLCHEFDFGFHKESF